VHYSLLAIDFLPPPLLGRLLRRVADKMADGRLRPLRSLSYSLASAAAAMRALAQAAHAGKVVAAAPWQHGRLAGGSGSSGGANVAVTGGTGGLGLLVASWMVSTGETKRVVLLSRTGKTSAVQSGGTDGGGSSTRAWSALAVSGAEIVVSAADSSFAEDSRAVWEGRLGDSAGSARGSSVPFDAVLHAAGVLTDAMVAKQSLSHMRR
jgi:NADPH:quinone reductase-like Zn-dependent oxidoreductase